MLILKHVGHEIKDPSQLGGLVMHLRETTSAVEGVDLRDVYFVKDKQEFVIFLECESEERYLEWREICPPPPGAEDWYEVLLRKEERFPG
jgi:hypothetical protein